MALFPASMLVNMLVFSGVWFPLAVRKDGMFSLICALQRLYLVPLITMCEVPSVGYKIVF